MSKFLDAIKKYWAIILGAIGILIVSIGAIFGKNRVKKSDAIDIHNAHTSGINAVIAANERDEKRRADALKEANEKLANTYVEQEKESKELAAKDASELTELVSKKFNFKNEDSK